MPCMVGGVPTGVLTEPQIMSSHYFSHLASAGLDWTRGTESYLSQCIHQLDLESQLLHKTADLIFGLVVVSNELTIWLGS